MLTAHISDAAPTRHIVPELRFRRVVGCLSYSSMVYVPIGCETRGRVLCCVWVVPGAMIKAWRICKHMAWTAVQIVMRRASAKRDPIFLGF